HSPNAPATDPASHVSPSANPQQPPPKSTACATPSSCQSSAHPATFPQPAAHAAEPGQDPSTGGSPRGVRSTVTCGTLIPVQASAGTRAGRAGRRLWCLGGLSVPVRVRIRSCTVLPVVLIGEDVRRLERTLDLDLVDDVSDL